MVPETIKVRQQVSLKRWKQFILERQASGLSIKAYCKAQGLSVHSYYYWQRKLRQQLLEQRNAMEHQLVETSNEHSIAIPPRPAQEPGELPVTDVPAEIVSAPSVVETKSIPTPVFVPLRGNLPALAGAKPKPKAPSICLHCGRFSFDIRAGTSPVLLRQVLAALREVTDTC